MPDDSGWIHYTICKPDELIAAIEQYSNRREPIHIVAFDTETIQALGNNQIVVVDLPPNILVVMCDTMKSDVTPVLDTAYPSKKPDDA